MEKVKPNLVNKFESKQGETQKTDYVPKQNNLSRVPEKDEFVLTDKKEGAEKTILGLTKKELLVAGGSIASTAGILGAVILKKGRNFDEAIKALKGQNDNLTKLSDEAKEQFAQGQAELTSKMEKALSEQKTKFEAEIVTIKDSLTGLMGVPENALKHQERLVTKYTAEIKDLKLSYDPLRPPIEGVGMTKPYWIKKTVPLQEIAPQSLAKVDNPLDIPKIISQIETTGKVELEIPKVNYKEVQKSSEAYIGDKPIEGLGKALDTDFKLAYGERTNWTDEKIARDIMQNFYDGHGNTLEGVKIAVEKVGDKYKIRISGDAMFEHENLRYLGSGNKLENPYNAGGFGEGSRVVVANLLGKGDADSVKFASADWELLFNGSNGIMKRTLNKSSQPVEGNFIEFETGNKNLLNSILKSTEYFDHPNNADFKGLTFENKSFGFRFLPEGEKGNIYLTQRFEFGEQGKWEQGVDNLSLIFKRKPDPAKYEKLIGEKFNVGRDRVFLTNDDVEKLTKYFSKEMSDEELMNSIMSTKDMWPKLSEKTPHALKSFLQALVTESRERGLAIDFSKERYAYTSFSVNETVAGTLESYGYKLCPEFLRNAGMDNAKDVFKSLSKHTPIEPTQAQVQKMKLLEEATGAIQEGLERTFDKKIKKIAQNTNIQTKISKGDFGPTFINTIFKTGDAGDFCKEMKAKYNPHTWGITDLFDQMNEAELRKFNTMLSDALNVRVKKLEFDQTSLESKETIKILKELVKTNFVDEYTKRQLNTLQNLDIITKEDVIKPRFIFDRSKELANNTLGESMVKDGYLGHWIDSEYLDKTNFSELLATWLHEICHKHGGDGTPEFTYKLTDLIDGIINSTSRNREIGVRLNAIEEVFDGIK